MININYHILKLDNIGVDINGFLESYEFIKTKQIPCDFILKLHSKISNNSIEGLNNWRQQLIDPITCVRNLIQISIYLHI